ncbi:MAG TPA: transglycosylase SLT domain-containing protein [Methylocella sp.]|nr:transglycosylase SLT domain-containing protein [Methylocella sp.]
MRAKPFPIRRGPSVRHSGTGPGFKIAFGPRIGLITFCAMATGFIAGQHMLFVPLRPGNDSLLKPVLPPLAQDAVPKTGAQQTPSQNQDAVNFSSETSPYEAADSTVEHDLTGFVQALAFYKSGNLAQGDLAAAGAKDPIVRTALEWIAIRSFPRESGFERLQSFMQAHPNWPALDWLKKRSEESLYGDKRSVSLIRSYFSGTDPSTPAGKLALARALIEEGKTSEAAELVRAVWREADLNAQIEAKVRADFGIFLDKTDHKYRADRLLYKEEYADAFRAAALAGADVLVLAKARAAVASEAASDRLMAAVPASLRNDPGFLFAEVHKLRHAEKSRAAADILLAAPRSPTLLIDGDAWWIERRLLARKLLDQNDPATAYRICAEHAATSREMQIEAEFHAGWIALRFLNDTERAAKHFGTIARLAETPMSRARAAYWQGRAAEASDRPDAASLAQSYYEQAANQPATFYGQLARGKLGLSILPIRTIANEAKGEAREDSIKVIDLLFAQGEKELATPLVYEAAHHLADERQVAALAGLVARQRDAHLSMSTGKILSQRGMPVDALAFPDYGVPSYEPLENSASASVVYSVARQESAFNATVVSSAGAKGLMQMILSTAKHTAEKAGIAFDERRLITDAAFNARLGARHLGELLAEQKGSYILAFAAYNAGGKKVKEWLDAYGDPRKPGIDPIDWVERIPFTETRNYVQRVIENLGVYRVRFGEDRGSSADLLIQTQAKL